MSISHERAFQKSAQSNHGLTLIEACDQNCLDRKMHQNRGFVLQTERQLYGSPNTISTIQIKDQ